MQDDDRAIAEQLLHRAVLSGDAGAWQRLYEESFDSLYRYALWRCGGSQEQADEVVQETWLIAIHGLFLSSRVIQHMLVSRRHPSTMVVLPAAFVHLADLHPSCSHQR